MAKNNKSFNKNIFWIIGGVSIAVIGIIIALVIALKPGENSTSSEDASEYTSGYAGTSEKDQPTGDLQVTDSGWTYVEDVSWGNSVWYGVAAKNDNKGKVASFPGIKVIARDADDKILFSDEYTCSLDYIYYGETLYCGGHYGGQTEKPAKVEFRPSVKNWENESAVNYPKNTDFAIKNVSQKEDYGTTIFNGEIFNNSQVNIRAAHIVIIFKKDGKIVGGDMTYSDQLNAGADDVFQMYVSGAPEYDEYEITAHVSMIN